MDKAAKLRKKGIIVRCFISRYIGREVNISRIEDSWGIDHGKRKAFVRHGKRAYSKSEIDNLRKVLPKDFNLDPFGGKTEVLLIDAESKGIMGHGEALCLDCDRFNRSMGYQIALNRALKNAQVEI